MLGDHVVTTVADIEPIYIIVVALVLDYSQRYEVAFAKKQEGYQQWIHPLILFLCGEL